ncbi:MAG: alkaline phosphatase family protein [Acidobacteria bacterium]|nr:alkaline phosphatase family protein [Acidobacteriota bacterium]
MQPFIPDYDGPCLSNVAPVLLEPPQERPAWLPPAAFRPQQVVLLALDGLGWDQLTERKALTPALRSLDGGPILTVAPSTTATALSSLALGCPPGEHGVVGYRINVRGDVLNVLRWQTPAGDARVGIPPAGIQSRPAFLGHRPVVVTRAEFAGTGFTAAHLSDVRLVGWRVPSTLVTEVKHALAAGERFVYAYYDGIDKVAHEYGLSDHYDAELRAVDHLVADLIDALPPGAALVVTSDHGQVDIGDAIVPIHQDVMAHVELLSGEGRFRWLHARPGAQQALLAAATRHHGEQAWVRTRDQVVDEEWFGPKVSDAAASRFGDVALAAIDPIAFEDPADTGPYRLRARHGSLTGAEMRIPLLAVRA